MHEQDLALNKPQGWHAIELKKNLLPTIFIDQLIDKLINK